MIRIPKEEFIDDAPDDEGEVRVNHDTVECSGTSKSMKIRRHEDGRVSARCFRCGGFGSYNPPESKYFKVKKRAGRLSTSLDHATGGDRDIKLPSDSEGDVRKWGVREREIVRRYDVTDKELERYGIVYSPRYNRVIFPVYRDSDLIGYQARSYQGEEPKYITKCGAVSDMWVYLSCQSGDSDTCTVVEDMWSGIRCSRFTNALVMLGSDTSDAGVNKMTQHNTQVIVFNDYDTPQVIKNAHKLKELLTLMGIRSSIISIGRDPKELSDLELETILNE